VRHEVACVAVVLENKIQPAVLPAVTLPRRASPEPPLSPLIGGMKGERQRKRVFLKSLVRENRTPGSVRGRSGNWPSYRDVRNDQTPIKFIYCALSRLSNIRDNNEQEKR
jgi:hypothetical protein